MNIKNFEDRVNPLDGVEQTDQGPSGPAANTNSGVLATLVQETPMGQGVVPVRPTDDEVVVHKSPLDEKLASNIPEVDATAPVAVIGTNAGSVSVAALLNREESEHFRTLWNEIQGKFVDEPRSAVQQADALVSEVIEKLTQMFASERGLLESQWKQGDDVSTEDLRKALQHYRSFFNRLVV